MPAFMAGIGMRQGMPRRQFNAQPPSGNQYTSALNAAGDSTAAASDKPVAPNTPTTQPANYNPYAAAASGGANPWTYNAQTGGYQPNSNAWTPDWMKKKEEPVGPVMKKERQLTDYTPYADTMQGTKQQALDLLAAEAKKRGVTPNWNDLQNKFGSRVQNDMVSGSLYNDIMKEAFGKDVDVEDKEATAAAAEKRKAAMQTTPPLTPQSNPWMTAGGGYGGYMPTQVYGQQIQNGSAMNEVRPVQMPSKYDDIPANTNPNDPRVAAKNADYATQMNQMRDLMMRMGQFNLSGMGG